LLEGVQYFLPTRAASWVDLGYNLLGILVGAGIVSFWKRMVTQNEVREET